MFAGCGRGRRRGPELPRSRLSGGGGPQGEEQGEVGPRWIQPEGRGARYATRWSCSRMNLALSAGVTLIVFGRCSRVGTNGLQVPPLAGAVAAAVAGARRTLRALRIRAGSCSPRPRSFPENRAVPSQEGPTPPAATASRVFRSPARPVRAPSGPPSFECATKPGGVTRTRE